MSSHPSPTAVEKGSRIEILLRSALVKDALSSVLMTAGFSVFQEPTQRDTDLIVVIDLDSFRDSEIIQAHQARAFVKIVGLASRADSLEMSPDDIAPLAGILTYDLSVDAFVQSLRLICSGERMFPRDLFLAPRPQASPSCPGPRSDGVQLSPREKEMVSHLTAGLSNKMIARRMQITEATAKVHLKNLLRKISAENRTQAAIWALTHLRELDTGGGDLIADPPSRTW